jgi:nicotinamidase-related amidase
VRHALPDGRLRSGLRSREPDGNDVKRNDPEGCAPEQCDTALLLIDVINDFDFPRGNHLLRYALPAALRIARLKKRLRAKRIPTIYVNDNFGRWRSDFRTQVERCASVRSPGAELVRQLIPEEDDYFVLKPKHSGFFSTSLDLILRYLGARKLILAGFATDICILFTANDAYMRDFELVIPADCVAAETASLNRSTCQHMKRLLRADIRPSRALRFK